MRKVGTTDFSDLTLAVAKSVRTIGSRSVLTSKAYRKSLCVSFGLLALYFLLGIAFYSGVEGWGAGDAFYFATVVLTTVGYGDLLPETDHAKVFTCFYVFLALLIAGVAIGRLIDAAQELAAESAEKITNSDSDCLFDEIENPTYHKVRALVIKFVPLAVWLVIGTLFFSILSDPECPSEECGDKWVNSFYFCVITVTTVGFGDYNTGTDAGKVFVCFYMVIGVSVLGDFLMAFTVHVMGEAQSARKLATIDDDSMTVDKFDEIESFVQDLSEKCNIKRQCQGQVDRFEFLSFVLVQNGIIEVEQIEDVIRNFTELDNDESGFVSVADFNSQPLLKQNTSSSLTKVGPGKRPGTTPPLPSKLGVPASSHTETCVSATEGADDTLRHSTSESPAPVDALSADTGCPLPPSSDPPSDTTSKR